MKTHKILGLMSGTSLDGLDLAYCHFTEGKGVWTFDIVNTKSIPYATKQQTELKDAIHLSVEDLFQLHNSYGTWLGEQVLSFIEKNQVAVDYVASHGHTTHHRPELGFTVQIGSGQHLANAAKQHVICDFRTNDIALGGQGAPLVPIGDQLLFKEYDFCLNLGGISNISFDVKGKRIAYDIGLANMILNYITRKINLAYDKGGVLARSGNINPEMLRKLNGLNYYLLPHPKSIGYEWFLEQVVPIVDSTEATTEDLLHTSIHHICEKITQQIQQNTITSGQKVLVTGGGALNTFLVDTLTDKIGSEIRIVVPEKKLINFKEAMVFAFMGALRAEKKVNVFSSVTGATRNSSSGVLYLPG
ncbi:anhydro-N-acetylmuramic acid kinase [Maribacter antarcticus]|uniref:anhydro-N-acetylmuramic acid kinase n=1 Tax=Maribacter antarcticus TaxID=505250 RepID=UPI00047D888E|nr:anhydro-N-acetylmuramic acid kinase [Maribacter antarcticus]